MDEEINNNCSLSEQEEDKQTNMQNTLCLQYSSERDRRITHAELSTLYAYLPAHLFFIASMENVLETFKGHCFTYEREHAQWKKSSYTYYSCRRVYANQSKQI